MIRILKHLVLRITILCLMLMVAFEYNHRKVYDFKIDGLLSDILFSYMRWAEIRYAPIRAQLLVHNSYLWIPNIWLIGLSLVAVGLGCFYVFRKYLNFYHMIRSKILGLDFNQQQFDFPFEIFRPENYFFLKPKNSIFLGLIFRKEGFFWSNLRRLFGRPSTSEPFYLGALQRSTHIQIIGRTGSGKTKLLETMILQDIQEGRGVVFIDGKGDLETKEKFCSMAIDACRRPDVHIFDLASPETSWLYNPVYMKPDRDPVVVAQKILSTFPCETEFYKQIQEGIFTLMLQIAHAQGKKVTLRDLHVAIRRKENLLQFAKFCPDQHLIAELNDFLHVHGDNYLRNVVGIEAWLRKYSLIDQINRTGGAPEIDFEYIFQKSKLVYFRLPSGYHQTYSKDIGQIVLQDLQLMAGIRQVGNEETYPPMSIYVDEFAVFAIESFIQAINKARSANIRWTIAHQSFSDLEGVSKSFANGVWDNFRTKIIMSQRNSDLCEKICAELGTTKEIERTERIAEGLLFTRKKMGDASTKQVDQFVLHPNFLKNLQPFGQAYVVGENIKGKDSFVGLNFGQVQCGRASLSPRQLTVVKTMGGTQ